MHISQTTSKDMVEMLRRSASSDVQVASAANREMAFALQDVLSSGLLYGDILGSIFERIRLEPGVSPKFPLDFFNHGDDRDFIAYTMPNWGRIPEKHVEGDYVMVPVYRTANSIDWTLQYARDARWDIVKRAMDVMRAGMVRKMNDDGWHTIQAAATGRNITGYDDAATSGLFTKRLISILQTYMRRNGGGNSASLNRAGVTDLYISPEALQDIRSWDLSQVDEVTRRQIMLADGETPMSRIFGVVLHDLDEMGVGQPYQTYITTTLAATLPTDKVEWVIALDLSKNDSFVMPVTQDIQVYEDTTMHRQGRQGFYCDQWSGFSCLDSRRVLLGAM